MQIANQDVSTSSIWFLPGKMLFLAFLTHNSLTCLLLFDREKKTLLSKTDKWLGKDLLKCILLKSIHPKDKGIIFKFSFQRTRYHVTSCYWQGEAKKKKKICSFKVCMFWAAIWRKINSPASNFIKFYLICVEGCNCNLLISSDVMSHLNIKNISL